MKYVKLIFLIILMFLTIVSNAQKYATTNFFRSIKDYNLASVLNADSIQTEGEEGSLRKVKREEILGFVGSKYQRFQIHFTSILKNPKNFYQYFASGKTLVADKVFAFKGIIIIKQAYLYSKSEVPGYKQGYAVCEIILNENKKEVGSGLIKGQLTSNFDLNAKGRFEYDALLLVSDSFSNNAFVGTWTSYKNNTSKKCNWGDYRIPNSGDLDNGTGEFMVADKYLKNGWLSYMVEHKMSNSAIISEKNIGNKSAKYKNWWQ